MRSYLCHFVLLSTAVFAQDSVEIARKYAAEVTRQLQPPAEEQRFYGDAVARLFAGDRPQFVAVVDRSPLVQAFLLYWLAADGQAHWIGASPVSTGHPGRFDYFETPLGVFDHSVDNPDYRAEGTRNENGICGYGAKEMRFQMHATDPDYLEPKLGTPQSKGCVRIPATLNTFLDRNGILDADYLRVVQEGKRPSFLRPDWQPVSIPGRYLVVIDTDRTTRPDWANSTPKPK